MIKQIVIVLSLSIVMQVSAMEIQPTIDDKKLCYLACMPVEVQNLIVSFAKDDETEEEFIARTKKLKKDDEYELCRKYNLYNKYHLDEFVDIAFCLDESKFVFFVGPPLLLKLVDREEDKILYSEEQHKYNRIASRLALSRHANMIAMFEHYRYTNPKGEAFFYVTIQNIVTQKKWECNLSIRFVDSIDAFEFNKQGTHIIIQASGIFYEGRGQQLPHLIVPIKPIKIEEKKIDTLLEIEDFNQKTPFQQYLIERRICKSIEASNPSILFLKQKNSG